MATKITWLGHGTFWLEINEHTLLLDPFLRDNPKATVDPDTLNPDFILVSHGHGDHVADVIDMAKRTQSLVITNAEITHWLHSNGVEQTHGQHVGGGYHHPFGYLKLTHAIHGSRLPDGSNGGNPAGFLITPPDGKKVYFACDTGLNLNMQLYGDEGIEVAVLPIGDNFTMGPEDSIRAIKFLRPKVVIPAHYNTWPAITVDEKAWAEKVRAETDAEPVLLEVNGSYVV